MDSFGNHPTHIHGHIHRDHRHAVKDVVKSLAVHKVLHVHRGQRGQMFPLLFPIVIEQATHGRRIFFTRLIAIHQHVPLYPHPARKFDQRL